MIIFQFNQGAEFIVKIFDIAAWLSTPMATAPHTLFPILIFNSKASLMINQMSLSFIFMFAVHVRS